MGGPGMILSQETLIHTVPHIGYCLRHLMTTHEDVEVGRCIARFAGATCTWAYEVCYTLAVVVVTWFNVCLVSLWMCRSACLDPLRPFFLWHMTFCSYAARQKNVLKSVMN
jgi:Chondroitin N-acetylgalactosaminyltransferase